MTSSKKAAKVLVARSAARLQAQRDQDVREAIFDRADLGKHQARLILNGKGALTPQGPLTVKRVIAAYPQHAYTAAEIEAWIEEMRPHVRHELRMEGQDDAYIETCCGPGACPDGCLVH